MMAKAYYTSYKLPIIITRGNNVYGPNQFPEKMIPKFTLLASRGEDLPVHGDGEFKATCLVALQTTDAKCCVCVSKSALMCHKANLAVHNCLSFY